MAKKKIDTKENILLHVNDLVSAFCYYDRKESESLSMKQLNNAIKDGTITVDEIVAEFRKGIKETFNDIEPKKELNDSIDC